MTHTAVPTQQLTEAALALAHAGRWRAAAALLDAAAPDDPRSRARLALAAAGVALESDWFGGTDWAGPRLAAADAHADRLDPGERWDLAFLWLRNDYRRALRGDGDGAPIGRRAGELSERAPDELRRGWAEMYRGLIADNLLDERDAAPAHYAVALRAGESGDPLLTREALRHLGGHDHDRGEHDAALRSWARATEAGAAAGVVPGTLSQQLLLAELARDTGDEPGAQALAREVARWADAIGAAALAGQARAFLTGVGG